MPAVPLTRRPTQQKGDRHDVPRRLRGRPAPPGDRAPARARADPAHPAERRRPALRRRHVGRSGPARSTTPSSQKLRDKGVTVHHFARAARRGARRARAPGSSSWSELTTATRFGPALDEPLRRAGRQSTPAGRWPSCSSAASSSATSTCRRTLEPAAGVPGRRRLPAARRCRTTCSSATTPPGSTTGCRSTRWPSRPASGRRSTPGWSTTSTRCSATPGCTSTTATTTSAHEPATVEGGDILVIGNGAVMIGMGERTTPAGRRDPRPAAASQHGTVDQGDRRRAAARRGPSCTSTPR